jgi:hypothetical protein
MMNSAIEIFISRVSYDDVISWLPIQVVVSCQVFCVCFDGVHNMLGNNIYLDQ